MIVNTYGRPKGKDAFRAGAKTMFSVATGADVYETMCRAPEDYRGLVESGVVHIPNWPDKNRHTQQQRWSAFAEQLTRAGFKLEVEHQDGAVCAYLKTLQLWCATVEGPRAKRRSPRHELESQLQLAFNRRFKISYYTRSCGPNQTWLGHVEVPVGHHSRFTCTFESTPPNFRDNELAIFDDPTA